MQKMIIQLVVESFATQAYPKAMDCLKALRRESIKVCFPFNESAHIHAHIHTHVFLIHVHAFADFLCRFQLFT